MTTLTGWLRAKACSQPGIDCTGAKAEEANVSGNRMREGHRLGRLGVAGRQADHGEAP